MKKVRVMIIFFFKHAFAYPAVQYIWISYTFIGVILMSVVWTSVYASSGRTAYGVPRDTVLAYYLLVGLITPLVFSNASRRMAMEDIKDGDLANYLLRPYSYFRLLFLKEATWRCIQTMLALPIVGFLWVLYGRFLDFHISSLSLVLFFFSLPFAYILSYLMQFCLGMSAFWIKEINGLIEINAATRALLSGIGIPIFFFPPVFKTIASYLPFFYNLYFPIQLFQGRLTQVEILKGFFIEGMWIILFFFLYRALWKKGLKIFSAVGR